MRIALTVSSFLLAAGVGLPGAVRADSATSPFDEWIAGLRLEALERNISEATLDHALKDVKLSEQVITLDRRQPEFKLTFEQYLDRVINDKRVRDGKHRLAQHRELLNAVHTRYGVPPRYLVALWGIESDFGRRQGSFEVIEALVTLAYDGRRARFFRGELLDALQILDEGHVADGRMLGSWAGAVGQAQFMPSSFRNFAVDHDGDSRRDLWTSVPDVLASMGNYLSKSGWRDDLIWGREVQLPDGFDYERSGRKHRLPLADWQRLGVRRQGGGNLPQADLDAAVVLPDGQGGRAFLVYDNFNVLLKWNRSDYFATAVGLLADRLVDR